MSPADYKPEFMVFAPNDWNGQWMNRQQLFSRIGKDANVVYSTGPWMTYNRRKPAFWKAPVLGSKRLQDNVSLLTSPRALPLQFNKHGIYSRLSNALYSRYINAQFEHPQDKILYLFHPRFNFLRKVIDHRLCVYHAYDDFSRLGYYTSQLETDETDLAGSADLVFASSRVNADRLGAFSDKTTFIPNGVDFQSFANAGDDEPADLRGIPSPRLGYTGRINQKVDLMLIDQLAEARPQYSFVLIGEVINLPEEHEVAYRSLLQRQNVHFLGNKSHLELPAYINRMDINLMSYLIRDDLWSHSIYPLKMHEYLATGRPVISASFDAVQEFAEVIMIADSPSRWLSLIDDTLEQERDSGLAEHLEDRRADLRRATAKANTWDSRVTTIMQKIQARLD